MPVRRSHQSSAHGRLAPAFCVQGVALSAAGLPPLAALFPVHAVARHSVPSCEALFGQKARDDACGSDFTCRRTSGDEGQRGRTYASPCLGTLKLFSPFGRLNVEA